MMAFDSDEESSAAAYAADLDSIEEVHVHLIKSAIMEEDIVEEDIVFDADDPPGGH
ncbi:MAG TPA: hypothetical protein VHN14_28110 [Kofleriaceae bacterium]|jgi:hypothetical protein|nr:hypothetical protein [Kofleriaceae bacterium]